MDAFSAALRNPGDSAATRHEFSQRRAERKANERTLNDATHFQGELRKIVAQRAQKVAQGVRVEYGAFEGYPAQIEYGQTGDPTRIDIYYGDLRQIGKDRTQYGHFVVRGNVLVAERKLGSLKTYEDKGNKG